MGDEKFMAMAGEMLDDEDCPVRVAPWASVLGARVWLAGHLEDVAHRVDAEATERAARVCDAKAREWNGLLEGGKGEYGKTGYVRDDTWKAWITSEHAARSLASAIRSTLPTPAARAGEENQ